MVIEDIHDPKLGEIIGERPHQQLTEDLDTVLGVYPEFNRQDYLDGKVCPVFYGSAVNNFGVRELLDCFVEIAPTPLPRETEERIVHPEEEAMSGFVFKIHANMDPKHRDRIAFLEFVPGFLKEIPIFIMFVLGDHSNFLILRRSWLPVRRSLMKPIRVMWLGFMTAVILK